MTALRPLDRRRYQVKRLDKNSQFWLDSSDYSKADEAVLITHPHSRWVGRAYRYGARWILISCLGNVISHKLYPRASFATLDGVGLHFAMEVEDRREELRVYDEWAGKAYGFRRKAVAR